MNRYLDVDASFFDVFSSVLEQEFAWLEGIKFKLLFNTKRRNSKGNIVLTSVELTNEKLKFLTADDVAPEGYDCLFTIDALAWQHASPLDRKRMIAHELNHVAMDDKGKLKIVGHDVEDFANEIQKNVDDPNWASKLTTLTQSIYEQQEDLAQGDLVQN